MKLYSNSNGIQYVRGIGSGMVVGAHHAENGHWSLVVSETDLQVLAMGKFFMQVR